ncbi:cytochrome P450, partial [Mycena pura]
VMSYTTVFSALIATLALFWITRRRSPIVNIAGPPSPSRIFGNMLQLLVSPQYGDYEFEWRKIYGSVYRVKGCLGQDRLVVSDPVALQYILNSSNFHYPPTSQAMRIWSTGLKSVVVCDGDDHRQLRSSLNPAFTAAAVRQYQPVFVKIAQNVSFTSTIRNFRTERMSLLDYRTVGQLRRAPSRYVSSIDGVADSTLLLIGLYRHLATSQSASQVLFDSIAARLPQWLLNQAIHLPTKTFGALRAQLHFANREGWRLVREKTEAANLGLEIEGDLYGVLCEHALVNSGRLGSNSLREEDIAAQTSIIMIAGQDTTANTLDFGLIELAKNPQLQESLRTEIHAAIGTDHKNVPYDSMPLLNAFIKESLRVYPAIPLNDRIASEDTVIPLSQSIATTTGERMKQIRVSKGDILMLACASYQRLMESRWGADANKFRPARWLDGTVHQGEAVGPYANLLTFHGGPRTCLGWRFAVLEMQVFLCELVGKFLFSLPANSSAAARIAGSLFPSDSQGNKRALLCVRHIL